MVVLLVDRPFAEEQISENTALDLRNIGDKVWPIILSKCRATDLRLYHITLTSLQGIETLISTKHFALEWATKIEALDPVFRLTQLTALSIFDFPKLRQLDGIEALHNLTELNLSGSRGAITSPLHLATIKPVTRLPHLKSFSLMNAKLDDDDITVLAHCTGLRHLRLSNQFDRVQVAFLAKKLNAQLAEPLTSYIDTPLKCEKCDVHKSMFIGRRMPILCRDCDNALFRKRIREFEQLVRDA